MKGSMALEYIFTILILLVTSAVIIMLIMSFSKEIRSMVSEFIAGIFGKPPEKSPFPETREKDSFSSREISTFIESCLSHNEAIKEGEQKDIVCYILVAKDMFSSFNVNKDSVLNSVDPNIMSRVEIKSDFSKPILKIKFEDIGNRIAVE
jgi:hypothetical protein